VNSMQSLTGSIKKQEKGLTIIHGSLREDKRECTFLTAILQIVHYAHISGIALGLGHN
jgi:hypothetical protein